MKSTFYTLLLVTGFLMSCGKEQKTMSTPQENTTTLDRTITEHNNEEGVKIIPITTAKGTFNVWTKRVGNNPKMKVLLLHGGPGSTHEAFECFNDFLPNANVEFILYDQLESYHSDQPNEPSLWTTDHFVEEVEQVRKALNLDQDNFYLLGQSWGGILAMEYALKYQDHLKGLIISNMMASIPEYENYVKGTLAHQLPKAVYNEIMAIEAEGDYENPRYNELLMMHYYTKHVLRMPLEDWPEPVTRSFNHMNPKIYIHMQGYSEFGITDNASLKGWDVSHRLQEITVPTLMIGGQYDTMDPNYMQWMSTQVKDGQSLTTQGSHLSQYDDPKNYFPGLINFIKAVNNKTQK